MRNYSEAKLSLHKESYNKKLAKEIVSFSGWNLFGSLSAMSVNQFRSILLNMFFGVTINASEGIAQKASSQLDMIANNIGKAIYPQLMKSEGSGDRTRMLNITMISVKYTSLLFSVIAIPVFIEMPYLFALWLKDVPEVAVLFSRIMLLTMFIDKFTSSINSAVLAVGEIKLYTLILSTVLLLSLPISYLLFRLGFPSHTIYIISFIAIILKGILRLYYGKRIVGIDPKVFIMKSVVPVLIPISISVVISSLLYINISVDSLRFLTLICSFCLVSLLVFYYVGVDKDEKRLFMNILKMFYKK